MSIKVIEVIQGILDGKTTKEIAEELFVSHHTIEFHRKNIMSKINVSNTAGLVRSALKAGIVV